jgi:hypothetical protein
MKRAAARARPLPTLLFALIPALLASRGCYFGEQDVPLGKNFEASVGGQTSLDDLPGAAGTGNDANAAAGSGSSGSSGSSGPGATPREPGVFDFH